MPLEAETTMTFGSTKAYTENMEKDNVRKRSFFCDLCVNPYERVSAPWFLSLKIE